MTTSKVKSELWRRGVLTWKLHAGQKKVHAALLALPQSVREAVVLISRRWGKSYYGVVSAIQDCAGGDNRQVFIIGPDLKQTRRIITPLLNKIAADAPIGFIKATKSDLTWRIGNSTLIIGAFDTALESLRGLEAYSMYLEESALANAAEYEYTLTSVLRPMLMHSKGRIVHLTTPPRSEIHPFVTKTLPEAELNKALHIYTIEDNPLLSKEDIEDEIKAMGGRDSEHCQRELFCRIVRNVSSLIVPEFSENAIKPITMPSHYYALSSIDFGGVKDNHAGVLGYFDFERNKTCYVDETWLDINTGTNEIVFAIREMEKRNNTVWLNDGNENRVIDCPGQTYVDLRQTFEFSCYTPRKGKDSVEDGIQALRVAFLNGEIEIDPRCTMLIATLKHGQWNDLRKDFQRSAALGHCDMLAALSYHFRHIDKVNNPFPPNLGKSRQTHFVETSPRDDNSNVFETAFFRS